MSSETKPADAAGKPNLFSRAGIRIATGAKSCLAILNGTKDDAGLRDFDRVIADEYRQIQRRRNCLSNGAGDAPEAMPENLAGLALSGGGIRSATFALGLLQHMARIEVLRRFDYLSTVSGGGYAGGWWSAWLSRTPAEENEEARPEEPADERPVINPPGPENLFPEEQIATTRWQARSTGLLAPDGSLSAQCGDPVHHLRLFSNYLTPQKGLLSADTWRAFTVVIRNLFLTWTILLPIVVVVVLLGQIAFVTGHHYVDMFPSDAALRGAAAHARLSLALQPVLVGLTWLLALSFLWLLNSIGRWFPSLCGIVAVAVICGSMSHAFDSTAPPLMLESCRYIAWSGCALAVAAFFLPLVWEAIEPILVDGLERGWPQAVAGNLPKREVRRNAIVRWQATIFMITAALAGVLCIAGFSGDLWWMAFDPGPGHWVSEYIRKAGGLGAAAIAVGSAAFTVLKAAPTASTDVGKKAAPRPMSQLVFAAAPVLAVLVIGIGVSAATTDAVRTLLDPKSNASLVNATWWGVELLLGFAAYDTIREEVEIPSWRRWLTVGLPAVPPVATMFWRSPAAPIDRALMAAALVATTVMIAGRVSAVAAPGGWLNRRIKKTARGNKLLHSLAAQCWGIVALSAIGFGYLTFRVACRPPAVCGAIRSTMIFSLVIGCGLFAVAEFLWLKSTRSRAALLVGLACLGLGSLVVPSIISAQGPALPNALTSDWATLFSLAVIALSVVIGVGWLADPNQLSLHAFYRARLIRAYLGASNSARRNEEITEAHAHDDLSLSSLKNCERGGPYHLINAAVNLVGGHDLATSQRMSDTFLMSQLYCGSPSTGFRPTDMYMHDALSLGTAVAVSGAAVSPNMGSKTPSSALAVLLTAFNVRLGYWAPNPADARWRSAQAHLWPWYTLKEALSQTTALSTYCYLTDGGHFDNTGIHALVARGCRIIVLADAGADPNLRFEDLGNAIRRCRIDFGTEIKLSLDPLVPNAASQSQSHVVFGTIEYSQTHAETLGWPRASERAHRQGVFVWIKPALTGADSVDVRQYGLEHASFPHETTADQWYGEAQFESYRQLGIDSARAAFDDGRFDKAVRSLAR